MTAAVVAVIWPWDLGELRVGFCTTALAGFLDVFSIGLFPPDFTSKLSILKIRIFDFYYKCATVVSNR